MNNGLVYTGKQKEVFTDSKIIADELEVKHKDLKRTINKIINNLKGAGQRPSSIKFLPVKLINENNVEFDGYIINKSGYMKLIMNLSG